MKYFILALLLTTFTNAYAGGCLKHKKKGKQYIEYAIKYQESADKRFDHFRSISNSASQTRAENALKSVLKSLELAHQSLEKAQDSFDRYLDKCPRREGTYESFSLEIEEIAQDILFQKDFYQSMLDNLIEVSNR